MAANFQKKEINKAKTSIIMLFLLINSLKIWGQARENHQEAFQAAIKLLENKNIRYRNKVFI